MRAEPRTVAYSFTDVAISVGIAKRRDTWSLRIRLDMAEVTKCVDDGVAGIAYLLYEAVKALRCRLESDGHNRRDSTVVTTLSYYLKVLKDLHNKLTCFEVDEKIGMESLVDVLSQCCVLIVAGWGGNCYEIGTYEEACNMRGTKYWSIHQYGMSADALCQLSH